MSELTFSSTEDVPRADYVATCHTPNCHNAEIPLTVPADVHEQYIVCGPCGVRVTDIVPVG
jgi:hypothetical protein